MAHPLKGKKQSPEHVAARIAARRTNGTLGGFKWASKEAREDASRRMSRRWDAGEFADRGGREWTDEQKLAASEKRRQMWADGRYTNKRPATRRRVSMMERSLKPYLDALGYQHTEQRECFIACEDRTRMPDFVDTKGRRVFEFFGDFWHQQTDEPVWIEQYHRKGWVCTVLWEHDLPEWLAEHAHLVAPAQHQHALHVCRVRNSPAHNKARRAS